MSPLRSKEGVSDQENLAMIENSIDSVSERLAVRKLDLTVLPVVTMFYLLSYLDRSNIGNARVAGLQRDLRMTDQQYQICVTVLFVPYILSELPSNLVLRKIGPRVLMPSLLTIWGLIATLQGLVQSFNGLVTVRAFLGLVEGPMLPAILLYLSGFYTRKDLSLRAAIFFSAASLSGAFSGLLAAAIVKMDGLGSLAGWSWIFILEGIFSFAMGIIFFFLVPSTPQDSKFLTQDEKDTVMKMLARDRPSLSSNDRFTIREVFRTVTSIHVLLVFIIFFLIGTTLYGMAFFLPSIVTQLGFSPNKTQLLSAGPFAAGFFVTLPAAYFSDRYETRFLPICLLSCLSVAGFAIYLEAESRFVAYGSLYLSVPGIYAAIPVIMAWMANNSEPYYRRATCTALSFIATNSGGILSTWRFPTNEGPKFRKTTIMDLSFSALIIVGATVNAVYLSYMNKRKKEKRLETLEPYAKAKDASEMAWIQLGDQHPDFKYTL